MLITSWKLAAVMLLFLACSACMVGEEEVAGDVIIIDSGQVVPQVATASVEELMAPLPDLGPAPEILNETWINADEPVTLASQRGKVVLLEFWTFG